MIFKRTLIAAVIAALMHLVGHTATGTECTCLPLWREESEEGV